MFGFENVEPSVIDPVGGIIGGIISAVAAIIVALIAKRKPHRAPDPGSEEWYRKKIDEHDKAIKQLRDQNDAQACEISALQRWKISALQYIAILIAGYAKHDLTPPEPPSGFEESNQGS